MPERTTVCADVKPPAELQSIYLLCLLGQATGRACASPQPFSVDCGGIPFSHSVFKLDQLNMASEDIVLPVASPK
jgi:hypothetical protein